MEKIKVHAYTKLHSQLPLKQTPTKLPKVFPDLETYRPSGSQTWFAKTFIVQFDNFPKQRKTNVSLVGGWATPLKNMKINWDDYYQYMGK